MKIKWNKETYDLELDTNEPPSVFKAQIFALTGVTTDRQKVMFKGGVIKDDEWNSTMLKSIKNVRLNMFCVIIVSLNNNDENIIPIGCNIFDDGNR